MSKSLKGVVKIDVRKLISFGKGSYILSMPKSWIEKNKLKKGDLISVDDEGFELVLSVNQREQKSEANDIDIDAKSKDVEVLKAEIVSSYLNNYDTVNILFDSHSKEAPKIKDIIRNLSGLEIMEQTSTRIVAKNLINISEISIQNIIRRMDIITRAMMEDVVLCYQGQCLHENINQRDVDVNRLYFLGLRVIKNAMKNPRIAKSLGTEPWQLHSDAIIIHKLEKIADRQKRISRFVCTADLDRSSLTELDRLHTDISEAYNNVMKAYYTKDKQLAIDTEITNKNRSVLCDRFLENYTQLHGSSKVKDKNSNLVIAAKIIENLKATTAEVRNIARAVLCYE
ncbi:phosphate uptake regulator PhoU [Candidatus Woesearchaeota archaeon]|nr:phosphate uptake regulator PhoU [Candidatus Woesearchaeota archaeon]